MSLKSPSIHQTPKYRAKAAYANMLRRCGNACGSEPAYVNVELRMTLEEWLDWSIPRYEKFINDNPGVMPNVSRKGDTGHYELDNIEIVSRKENRNSMAMPGQALNGMKRCSRCRVTKPVEMFSKNKTTRDGWHHACKQCKAELHKIKKKMDP